MHHTARQLRYTVTMLAALSLVAVSAGSANAACGPVTCAPVLTHSYFGTAGDACSATWTNSGGCKSVRVVGTNADFFDLLMGSWFMCEPAASPTANWVAVGSAPGLTGNIFHMGASPGAASCQFQFRPCVGSSPLAATETCVANNSDGLPVELLQFGVE